MLDVQGQAILMDFGIVKIIGGENHTATGAIVGTAMYMSPEMIRGEMPRPRAPICTLWVLCCTKWSVVGLLSRRFQR